MTQDYDAIKAAARRLADDVSGRGDLGASAEIFAGSYRNDNVPVPGIPATKARLRRLVEATRAAFPDLTVDVQDLVAEPDLLAFHDRLKATSEGEFFGVPRSGKPLESAEIHLQGVAGGQVTEQWTNFDQLGILTQLGAIPS